MKLPDLDRIRSEKLISFGEFLRSYNEKLPTEFPQATLPLLREFRKTHASLFKIDKLWSLDQHRKKVMDWLTARSRVSESE
jgi:hypothetical protein